MEAMDRLCGWKEEVDEIESTGELVRGPGDPARDRSVVPAGDSLGENVNDRAGEVERPSIAFWFFRFFGGYFTLPLATRHRSAAPPFRPYPPA